jgi:hypothetical protein
MNSGFCETRRRIRDFERGTFRLATVDVFPASKAVSGGPMIISKGRLCERRSMPRWGRAETTRRALALPRYPTIKLSAGN